MVEIAPGGGLNIHGTALIAGETGVLLRGESGSGKSALALDLIAAWNARGRHAALVADDRVLLSATNGRVLAHAPGPIRNMAEMRGYGILQLPAARGCVIDLVADFIPADLTDRMPEPRTVPLCGVELPGIGLPAGDTGAALRIVSTWLDGLRPVPEHS